MQNFLNSTPTAYPLFFRSYSRWGSDAREPFPQVVDRCISGATELGKLTEYESTLLRSQMESGIVYPSGRSLWCLGTEWSKEPQNYYGLYNCSSTEVDSIEAFGCLMNLAMTGCGTGANLEPRNIEQLPVIRNRLEVEVVGEFGTDIEEKTRVYKSSIGGEVAISVGDSRQGWVDSYTQLLKLATSEDYPSLIHVEVDISAVRPAGTKLKGFGGVANPVKLPELYNKIAKILNGAIGRKLTALECCQLIDIPASVIVAGNIRRSAGIRQFAESEPNHKQNLWIECEDGTWKIDPDRDALRMANHTRVYHQKPTLEQCIDSVRSQYHSGEGAIQWAGEAVARANADILNGINKYDFLSEYDQSIDAGRDYLEYCSGGLMPVDELDHRMNRYGLNPCGEIVFSNGLCNLADVHLNQIDPLDLEAQDRAFEAAAIHVAALLHHKFDTERYRISRELDPIVGVSFTGLFDFFVNLLGAGWLRWWEAGRPDLWQPTHNIEEYSDILREGYGHLSDYYQDAEQAYLQRWQKVVTKTVADYCDQHNLKCPNRCTTVQPSGSKSLLTGASPGWHPPKAQRFIRRITFRKNDPVALACIDYGHSVIPSQSDKDENGNLLDDAYDPRCTEWLIEIPCAVPWADIEGVDAIDISQFSALAQMDFYLQVQQHYTQHNTSATIELREHEIEPLAERIYEAIQNDEGYISAALLARFDDHQSFPRLPFEPIDKATYDRLVEGVLERRKTDDFHAALAQYDSGPIDEAGPAGCDSDKCLLGGSK